MRGPFLFREHRASLGYNGDPLGVSGLEKLGKSLSQKENSVVDRLRTNVESSGLLLKPRGPHVPGPERDLW
jgi:hypothetical protein